VHVPELINSPVRGEKQPIGVGLRSPGRIATNSAFKSKYQSKWYGNPLALTIYVNANELRFSPNDLTAICAIACSIVRRRSIYVEEIDVCLNGWVTFLSKRRS
jgi:hypothetical protein